jgi:predicted enzyme related to lactoylglutathione lyase
LRISGSSGPGVAALGAHDQLKQYAETGNARFLASSGAPTGTRVVGQTVEGDEMANPVVHFEVIGKDGPKLQAYYADLFGWQIDANNPMNYGLITDSGNGVGGGIAAGPEGYEGHVTFYVQVPDIEAALVKAESLGGTRIFGPETIMENVILGQFTDPEGHVIGLTQE